MKKPFNYRRSSPDGGSQGGEERSDPPLHSEHKTAGEPFWTRIARPQAEEQDVPSQLALPMRRIKTEPGTSRFSEKCRAQALKLLARREHSRAELSRKLVNKGWNIAEITLVLDELNASKLQDDLRFAEAYIRYRSAAGYGPRRIVAELAERGIKLLPSDWLDETNPDWLESLRTVWQKKFNAAPPDLKAKAKQINFLIYRGFTPNQVNAFFKEARML